MIKIKNEYSLKELPGFINKARKRHKYNAKSKAVDGIHFHSTKEADYYEELLLKEKAGVVLFFLRQVPFDLPGGAKHRIDFVEFMPDGRVTFVEVKGYDTPAGKLKRKMIENLYPIKIELV